MNNFLTTSIAIFVLVFLLWCIGKLKSVKVNHGFKNGFDYAETTFDEHSFKSAIEELLGYVEESRTFDSYNDFDKGIEQVIKERILCRCDILNAIEGGDWYFCNESLKFKDSLTSREIVL